MLQLNYGVDLEKYGFVYSKRTALDSAYVLNVGNSQFLYFNGSMLYWENIDGCMISHSGPVTKDMYDNEVIKKLMDDGVVSELRV